MQTPDNLRSSLNSMEPGNRRRWRCRLLAPMNPGAARGSRQGVGHHQKERNWTGPAKGRPFPFRRLRLAVFVAFAFFIFINLGTTAFGAATPGVHWESRSPDQAGLAAEKLAQLAAHVGGRGCVVRDGFMVFLWGDAAKSGDVASAFKPVLSALLLMAVNEGRLPGVDARLSLVEPRLADLNGGKDAAITWRHLASQLSGYGLVEKPGEAYSYNDYALTLYYDTL